MKGEAKRKAGGDGDAEPRRKKAKKVKKLDKDMSFEEICSIGHVKIEQTDFEGAIKWFLKALAKQPKDTDTMDALGECYINIGKDDEARKILAESVELDPESSYAKYMFLAQISKEKEALGHFLKGIEVMKTQLADARPRPTEADEDEDEDDEDEEEDEDLLDMDADELKARLSAAYCSVAELYLTDLCFEDNAEKECEKYLEESEKVDAEQPEVHQLRGSLRISQQRTEDAKTSLLKAASLLKNKEEDELPTIPSMIELCKLLLQVDEPRACKTVLADLFELDDTLCESPYLWYLSGLCYQAQKQFENALKCFSRCEKFGKKEPEPDTALAEDNAKCLKEVTEALEDKAAAVNVNEDIEDDELEESDAEEDEEDADPEQLLQELENLE